MIEKKIHLASKIECTGCSACASICPSNCISMVEDREGFLQPRIKARDCLHCHLCEKTCPILNPKNFNRDYTSKAIAVINKNDKVRLKSSSGGVFYAIAEWVINNGGVVFGAKFDDDYCGVYHDFCEEVENLDPLLRSKYLQSRIGQSYSKVKSFLEQKRIVLFSGTPCQISGLLRFLGSHYDNLITVDVICHGVPSPGVWKHHLEKISHNSKIIHVNFRDKCDGWSNSHISIEFSNGARVSQGQTESSYFLGFLRNDTLRKSCYECRHRTPERESDLTVADYWGVDKLCPEMYDNKGTSTVLVHSKWGEYLIDCISDKLAVKEQTFENALKFNQGANGENPKSHRRNTVFFYYKIGLKSIASYASCHDNLVIRARRKLKKIIAE